MSSSSEVQFKMAVFNQMRPATGLLRERTSLVASPSRSVDSVVAASPSRAQGADHEPILLSSSLPVTKTTKSALSTP